MIKPPKEKKKGSVEFESMLIGNPSKRLLKEARAFSRNFHYPLKKIVKVSYDSIILAYENNYTLIFRVDTCGFCYFEVEVENLETGENHMFHNIEDAVNFVSNIFNEIY